jgi:O-antigen/teichoic acid export membrane protein
MSQSASEPRRGFGRSVLLGTLYMGAGGWITYALNFLIMIGIARLLGPAEFGAYAFVAALNEFLNMVGAGSVGHAVLQSRDDSQRLHDTAYSITGILGLIGLAAALLVAPVLFVQRGADTAWFILVLGVARVVTLLAAVPIALMERSFRYGRLAWLSSLTGVVPNLFALGLAWSSFGAWSLIARDVLVAVSMFALSHLWTSQRFRFRMGRAEARRIMDFYRPMFVSRSLDTVSQRIDRLAVGWFFGDAVLGLYHQARLFSEIGPMAVRAVNQLAFNLYSRVQEERERLARAAGLVNFFLVRGSFAIASVFLVFPEAAIRILLGEAWVGAAPVLRWLALYVGLVPSLENLQWLLYARGQMSRGVQLRLVQIGVLAFGLLAALMRGDAADVAAAVSVSTLIALAAAIWMSRAVVGRSALRVFLMPSAALLASAALCFAIAAMGALAAVPEWLLPALPPAVFVALLLIAERDTLLRELGYLRAQLAQGRATGPLAEGGAPGPI